MKVEQVCVICSSKFYARKNSRFCSGTCRKRNERGVTDVDVTDKKETSVTGLSKLSKDDIYAAINSYPQDTWKDSPEFRELKRRLKSMTVEELYEKEYFIPSWKEHGLKSPDELIMPQDEK